eukprot:TRINITY_DN6921_c0_g1_i1.p1 TRINITY_DN6921_c0_g1~~TRINITY_DN6921_c0_g1_i1.p1  ORF type:complete len:624 (+),score=80.61 TRINITY_DN6921_c0_g1_i1:56-1927(+)
MSPLSRRKKLSFDVVWLVGIFFSIASHISGQPHCEAPLNSLSCSEIGHQIYIDSMSQADLDLATQPQLTLARFDAPECQAIIRPFICHMFLPKCLAFGSLTIPQRICKSACIIAKERAIGCQYSNSFMSRVDCDDQRFFDPAEENSMTGICTTLQETQAHIDVSALGSCQTTSGSTCDKLLKQDETPFFDATAQIYVPYGASVQMLEDQVQQATYPLNLMLALTTGEKCSNQIYRLICLSAMRKCVEVDYLLPLDQTFFGNLTTYVKIAYATNGPCMSMCISSGLSCINMPMEDSNSNLGLNCSATDPIAGMPLYLPDGLSMETIPGIVIECDSATEINSYTKLEPLDCVSPLLYEASKDPVCQQPCMWYIFSEEETERLRDVVTICAHFSFFLDLVVLATYAAYPKKRRFPNNIAWYITITSTLIAFLVVLTYWNGYKETFCVNETERRTMEGYCVVQGVLVLWLGLAAVFWWLFLVISLLCTIVLDVQVKKRHIRLMHIFCWGIPFVLNIYALSVDAVGYDGFSFFCSFGENANVTTEFVVLFGWMVASVAIGCPIVIWILIHVIKVARSVHKGRAFLQSYIRLLMIIISLMILFTFTFALRFHVRSMEKDIQVGLFFCSV